MGDRVWSSPRLFAKYGGDREAARRMERRARTCVGYLFDQLRPGQTYRVQSWNYIDGSRIKAHVWRDVLGERARVEIYAPPSSSGTLVVKRHVPYEAGLLSIVNQGGGNFTTLLYLSDPVGGQYADLVRWGDAEDGAIFYPNGKIELAAPIVLPIKGSNNPETYTPQKSIVSETLKREASALLITASLFSGKLRLYVQALYGGDRSDFGATLEATWPIFQVAGVTMEYHGRGTTILLTTDDWRYFLVDLNFDDDEEEITLAFRELVPLTEGKYVDLQEWALQQLRAEVESFDTGSRNNDNQAILETLVLANLAPSPEPHSTVTVPYPSVGFKLGFPLAYGWHANWAGDEARITLVTTDPLSYGVGGSEIQLDITHTIDSETGEVAFSADVSCGASVTGKVKNSFYLWVPTSVYLLSASSFLSANIYVCSPADPENATIIPDPSDEFDDLPLYGFFDRQNVWQRVSWSRAETTKNIIDGGYGETEICHGHTFSRVQGLSGSSAVTEQIIRAGNESLQGATFSTHSFGYASSSVVPGEESQLLRQKEYEGYGSYVICNGGVTFGGLPWSDIPGIAWFTYTDATGSHLSYTVSGYQAVGRLGIVIPHNDCDVAVLVHQQTTSSDGVRRRSQMGAPLGATGRLYSAIHANDSANNVPGELIWSGSDVRGARTGYLLNWPSVPVVQNETSSTSVDSMKALAVHPGGVDVLVSGTVATGDGLDTWSELSSVAQFPYPAPYGTGSGEFASDWLAFLEAPYGVCTAGLRDLNLVPTFMLSAVYTSKVGRGTPSGMYAITSDGLPFNRGETFVGWG